MPDPEEKPALLELTAKIVAAHLSGNSVPPADLPGLIRSVHDALASAGAPPAPAPEPAVPVKKSVTPNYLVCLEDGKKLKMLKRHLRTAYNMSPDDYRARWGLASDYPMVASAYAKQRSELAKKIGLGRRPRKAKPKPRKRRAKA
jgi:predicted transcriptional regulator